MPQNVEAEVDGVKVTAQVTDAKSETTEITEVKKERFGFIKRNASKLKAGMILVGCTVAGAALGMKIQKGKDDAALNADIDTGILLPGDDLVTDVDIPDTPVDIEV